MNPQEETQQGVVDLTFPISRHPTQARLEMKRPNNFIFVLIKPSTKHVYEIHKEIRVCHQSSKITSTSHKA